MTLIWVDLQLPVVEKRVKLEMQPNTEFEDVMRRNLAAVERLLRLLEFNHEDVKDLTADVFVLAFTRKEQLLELSPTAQRAWLLKVARNLLMNHGRRRATQRRTIERLSTEPLLESELANDPFYGFSELEDHLNKSATIQLALKLIGVDHSKILLLEAVGNSGVQIAQALGISHSAARKRLMNARSAFRNAYQSLDEQLQDRVGEL